MKLRVLAAALALAVLFAGLCGCAAQPQEQTPILATTAPLHAMTEALLQGTDLSCGRLITESVSCLHDYTLTVSQMQAITHADVVILNGLGLEDFMTDALQSAKKTILATQSVPTLDADDGPDPHVWLSPENCILMCRTIAGELCALYPQQQARIEENLRTVIADFTAAQQYGEQTLAALSCRELVTFHDGFAYFAEAFDLHIAAAMEIEHGSEPSARELESVIHLVQTKQLPAIFTEENGESSAAETVARQTGVAVYTLTMGLSEGTCAYTDAIYHNINTLQEALR